MKTSILSIVLAFTALQMACDVSDSTTTALVLVIDHTDPLTSQPSDEIYTQLDLEKDIFQGVSITVTYLSDKDINRRIFLNLPASSPYKVNKQVRKAEVARFKTDLSKALNAPGVIPSKDHSILYRSIAKEINLLSNSKAQNRHLLVYSNLMENSELVFFDPGTLALINSKPKVIIQQLEAQTALKNLHGISISLIYEPSSFEDNNSYMSVARLYKTMFEAKGASTQIVQSFTLTP